MSISPRKSLGQNFLRDENIVRKIVESIHPAPGERIVEIGSGPGALTRPLAASGAHLTAIEVDTRAVQLLREEFGSGIDVIHASVLDVDLRTIAGGEPVRVAGNIPYNLTSEILFWLFDQRTLVRDATLMLQLEVARRLAASPRTKEYGILSVFTRFYTDFTMLFKVSRNCFFPRPDVDSAVVHFTMRPALPPCNERTFRSVVRAAFGMRRKTLRNSLRAIDVNEDALAAVSIDPRRRAEDLTLDEFVALTNSVTGTLRRSG